MLNDIKKTQGLTLKNVQEHNRSTILREVYERGLCSRTEIGDKVGLDQATITRAVQRLVDEDLLVESIMGKEKGQRGRRSIGLQLSPNLYRIVAVRLQRLSFKVALWDLTGTSLKVVEKSINPSEKPFGVFDQIVKIIDQIISDCRNNVLGIGVTLPGPFLEGSERIILMTESPEWQNFDLVHKLREHYEEIPLFSKHDAKAAALSVWNSQGINSGSEVMLYLSAGQGIGAGIVINGKVFRGSQGTAGELGHTSIDKDGPQCHCGNFGCLEMYSSRLTLFRNLKKNKKVNLPEQFNLNDVVEAYQKRSKEVVIEVDKIGEILAQGLVNSINFLNPDLIILGDEYASFGETFLNTIEKNVREKILPKVFENLTFALAKQNEHLVITGSYHHVLQSTLFDMNHLNIVN